MKIALTQNTAIVGGVPNYIFDLAAGLKGKGHEVWIIMPEGPMVQEYKNAGLMVVTKSPRADIDIGYIKWLRSWLIKNQIEVLHANMLKTVVNGLIAAYLAKTPVRVVHIHGTLIDWEVPEFKKRLNVLINRLITNWMATDVIALTRSIKSQLVSDEGIKEGLITVIPNGVSMPNIKATNPFNLKQNLNLPSNSLIIGTFSRLTLEKGLTFLIEAMPSLTKIFPNLHTVIAGDGQDREMLEDMAKQLGVASKTHFLGFQPNDLKYAMLQSFDVFAFPSTREGFGIGLLEAMAVGTPIVCSDLPVLKDIVKSGQTGILCRVGDSVDLSRAIAQAINMSDSQRRELADRARAEVRTRYTVDIFVSNYEKLYTKRLSLSS